MTRLCLQAHLDGPYPPQGLKGAVELLLAGSATPAAFAAKLAFLQYSLLDLGQQSVCGALRCSSSFPAADLKQCSRAATSCLSCQPQATVRVVPHDSQGWSWVSSGGGGTDKGWLPVGRRGMWHRFWQRVAGGLPHSARQGDQSDQNLFRDRSTSCSPRCYVHRIQPGQHRSQVSLEPICPSASSRHSPIGAPWRRPWWFSRLDSSLAVRPATARRPSKTQICCCASPWSSALSTRHSARWAPSFMAVVGIGHRSVSRQHSATSKPCCHRGLYQHRVKLSKGSDGMSVECRSVNPFLWSARWTGPAARGQR